MMDPNAGPAMPPELMAALAGGAGAGGPAMMGGGPMDTGGGPTPAGPGGNPEDQPIEILRQMIDLANQYLQAEPDEVDKSQIAKILAQLQAVIAKDQADRDKLVGNPAATRMLRKS